MGRSQENSISLILLQKSLSGDYLLDTGEREVFIMESCIALTGILETVYLPPRFDDYRELAS